MDRRWNNQGQQQNFTFDFLNANFNDTTYTVGLNAQTQHTKTILASTVTVYPDPIAQINQLASVYLPH